MSERDSTPFLSDALEDEATSKAARRKRQRLLRKLGRDVVDALEFQETSSGEDVTEARAFVGFRG